MTAFTYGQNINVNLNPVQILQWNGSGYATITPTGSSVQMFPINGSYNIGPFGQGASVNIVTSSSGSYNVITSSEPYPVAQIISDYLNNPIGIVNPNGGTNATGTGKLSATGAFSIAAYGAKSDGKQVKDVTTTNSTTCTITSAAANFTSSDVGKSCVVISSDATGSVNARGTITAYTSSTQVTATLSGAPTVLSGAEFIYGTDDTVAINSATAAAALARGSLFIPAGISIFTSSLLIPAGISKVSGVGNKPFAGLPENAVHIWTGSTLVLIGNISDGITFNSGSANSAAEGMSVSDLNMDFTNKSSRGVFGAAWSVIFDRCTIARAYTTTVELTGSMVLRGCTVFNQQQGSPVKMNPSDTRCVDNYIYGAATTLPLLTMSGHDQIVTGNHFFRDPDATGAIGSAILVSQNWGAGIGRGSNIISGNMFDTQKGSCIEINVSNNSILQATNISNNCAFQNAIANDTYSYIKLTVAAGSAVKALTITGNTGQGDFQNAATDGVWKSFIDGVGISGNVYGATVMGNAIDNCNLLYTTFTPSYSAGNVTIAGYGTTVAVG